jgi:hypothetical protein
MGFACIGQCFVQTWELSAIAGSIARLLREISLPLEPRTVLTVGDLQVGPCYGLASAAVSSRDSDLLSITALDTRTNP